MLSFFNGYHGAIHGYLRLPDGKRPENLSLFHYLNCKNNVILDYYGVWRTYAVMQFYPWLGTWRYVNGHVTLVFGKNYTLPIPLGHAPEQVLICMHEQPAWPPMMWYALNVASGNAESVPKCRIEWK